MEETQVEDMDVTDIVVDFLERNALLGLMNETEGCQCTIDDIDTGCAKCFDHCPMPECVPYSTYDTNEVPNYD
jgi:hypothetical protein